MEYGRKIIKQLGNILDTSCIITKSGLYKLDLSLRITRHNSWNYFTENSIIASGVLEDHATYNFQRTLQNFRKLNNY